ncbi:hypothetical protein PHYBLDRAFT_181790 [Phycomyces blakesleeanus NRRL 1555(-)]|uniref:Uncharacterized protein n=1 Tax=Phycomyces blakesleeanus (strain ATCC 8743b / DSM 1359 / FGSC 10004 / NBRC 33097 / NRRL 1555) TaxID=763407 RepID=A0A162PRS6_PHYB8|nr:hypothetical protein PHYBLDRAFT_181790 [Phycomyces blakesleeanus NRRL 1555(-)]OAD72306.1 hypothetical protein PHYBLDRAFT_181790 [Phycomyces blakesleeanus NRRL 1555(-)]|eukprot:XP_018290346.1 hypothetical protein PHYBLDRAFT_181790 [Phycomyces blakesleeanus NRRL 1555(-)]
MSTVETFSEQVRLAATTHNAGLFSDLFQLEEYNPGIDTVRCESIVNRVLEDQSSALSEFVCAYLVVLRNLKDPSIIDVYDHYANFYSTLVPVFNGADTFYQVSLVRRLSSELVSLAFLADNHENLKGKARKTNSAARLLSKIFNIMLADRAPMEESKRQGIFHITNLAFKAYFKLDSIRLCQTLISNIRTGNVNIDIYPIAQQVTYRYYLGRYYLYSNLLRKADECLSFAFDKCTFQQWNNKRLILKFLIPCRIILGKFPSMQLLTKYQLVIPFAGLIQTLKSGNLYEYLNHLDVHFGFFYKTFTYVMLRERGTVLVWTCLLRRLSQIVVAERNVMTFDHCHLALSKSTQDPTLDMQDTESILVSLVSQRYIRGYLYHQKRLLVLSKTAPFPPISAIRVYTEKYDDQKAENHLSNVPSGPTEEVQEMVSGMGDGY